MVIHLVYAVFTPYLDRMSKTKFLRKKQLLKLVDRLPGTICQYREWPDGRCRMPYSTPAVEAFFFATPKELSKNAACIWERITPETAATLREALNHSAQKQEEFKTVFGIRSPRGHLH